MVVSWSPEDHIRHFPYQDIYRILFAQSWEPRPYQVLDFPGKWYADESGIGWRSHLRTMMKTLLGDRLVCIGSTYPEEDIENLPHFTEYFDVILCDQVLEHVARPWKAAEEISRVCTRGGIAVVATPGLYPIHPSPKDYWRLMPDAYELLFSRDDWEWLTFGQWGTALRISYEYSLAGGAFPYGPPHRSVEQSVGTPDYTETTDERCPLQLWWVGRKH